MTTPNLAMLGTMVAASQGWPAANALKAYRPTDSEKAVIANLARDMLRVYPENDGACAPMRAAFAVGFERVLQAPVQVVAGSLFAEDVQVFGENATLDAETLVGGNDLNRDGHVWVMIGAYVADISLFWTAYSRLAHPALSRHVAATFGPGKGMCMAPHDAAGSALRSAPRSDPGPGRWFAGTRACDDHGKGEGLESKGPACRRGERQGGHGRPQSGRRQRDLAS